MSSRLFTLLVVSHVVLAIVSSYFILKSGSKSLFTMVLMFVLAWSLPILGSLVTLSVIYSINKRIASS